MEDDQPAPANLAAAFRAEGAPIRVGSAHLNMLTALPYSMGIIAAYTRELLRQSTPSIEEFVKRVMTRNTAEVLDNIVFDNQNVSATRPRGLTYGMDPADTAVATATPTYAQVDSDLNKRIRQLTGVRHMGGPNTYWVMSHSNAAALSGLITPTGIRFYPDVTAEGAVLKGYRVATSSYYKNDEVLLIDADQIFFAGGSPEFEVSDQATLHMENTTPLQIGTAGAPATIAAPTQSLWQTNSEAVRMLIETSWLQCRNGAVQQLTGVAW
jgi:HK97 family phage major capsid protein